MMSDKENSPCVDCGCIENDYIIAKKDEKEVLICGYCFKNNYRMKENKNIQYFIAGGSE